MALLNWLFEEITFPSTQGGKTPSPSRKEARIERRDLLFTVISEVMSKMGMVSSSYKFKVLTLNAEGYQHLIMIDMVREHMQDTDRLEQIESHIKQEAKQQHDLAVHSVYFRVNDHLKKNGKHNLQSPSVDTTATTDATEPTVAPAPLNEPSFADTQIVEHNHHHAASPSLEPTQPSAGK